MKEEKRIENEEDESMGEGVGRWKNGSRGGETER